MHQTQLNAIFNSNKLLLNVINIVIVEFVPLYIKLFFIKKILWEKLLAIFFYDEIESYITEIMEI